MQELSSYKNDKCSYPELVGLPFPVKREKCIMAIPYIAKRNTSIFMRNASILEEYLTICATFSKRSEKLHLKQINKQ